MLCVRRHQCSHSGAEGISGLTRLIISSFARRSSRLSAGARTSTLPCAEIFRESGSGSAVQDDLRSLLISLTELMEVIEQALTSSTCGPAFRHRDTSDPAWGIGQSCKGVGVRSSSRNDRGSKSTSCRQPCDEGQSRCATAQVVLASCGGTGRLEQDSGSDRDSSGEGTWEAVVCGRLWHGHSSSRTQRRRVRWNDRGQLWQQRQDERTSIIGTCEKNLGGASRDHPRFPTKLPSRRTWGSSREKAGGGRGMLGTRCMGTGSSAWSPPHQTRGAQEASRGSRRFLCQICTVCKSAAKDPSRDLG